MVTPGFVVTQASTLLLVALGVFALAAKPRTRASRGFGCMGVGLGVGISVANFIYEAPGSTALGWAPLAMAGYAVALAGLWAIVTPSGRVAPNERNALLVLCATLTVGLLVGLFLGFIDPGSVALRAAQPLAFWTFAALITVELTTYVMAPLLACALFALRHLGAPREAPSERAQWALMAAGLGAMSAAIAGTLLLSSRLSSVGWGISAAVLVLLAACAWLVSGARGFAPREARLVAWTLLTLLLAGMLVTALAPRGVGNRDTGFYGVVRLFAFGSFGYAILRHQMLGLDVKVRFAISKSTIAAVFIAVFFVASEVAQQFFGSTFSSAYVGIAAAGALVFAMAPLQRAAERLAEKAVPIASAPVPAASPDPVRGADSYRRAARLALKDRRLTRREEIELAHVAHDLGLTAPQAMRILQEVEDEVHGARGDGA